MVQHILDRIFLFVYSFASGIIAIVLLFMALGWFPWSDLFLPFLESIEERAVAVGILAVYILLSLRFIYLSLRPSHTAPPSIEQRTSLGDIHISLDTIENLALQSASRVKGTRELKAKVKIDGTGMGIQIRTLVDGEVNIPKLSEEIQGTVAEYVERITGIPVAYVSVHVANVAQSHGLKSRVN